jgi:hypothetical protein
VNPVYSGVRGAAEFAKRAVFASREKKLETETELKQKQIVASIGSR